MDIRKVTNLLLDNVRLKLEFPDEHDLYRIENCDCLKQHILS